MSEKKAREVRETAVQPFASVVDRTPPIDEIVATLVREVRPVRIVMFGSRALGTAGPDSDLDLMIEVDRELDPRDESIRIHQLLWPRDYALDVKVYTPSMIAERRGSRTSFLAEIEGTGKVLYERP